MLSVQSPGCAGMERLGVPARSSIGSQPVRDERTHMSRRMRVEALQSHDISVRNTNNSHHHYDYHNIHRQHNDVIRCPHHVALSDGEWGPDRDLQIRAPYQQTEITRTYIKPPPNKTAFDVPEQSYNLFPSSSACNLSQRSNNNNHNNNLNNNLNNHNNNNNNNVTTKSKPNPIAKFFLRISNSKSPETQSRTVNSGTINNSSSTINSIGTILNQTQSIITTTTLAGTTTTLIPTQLTVTSAALSSSSSSLSTSSLSSGLAITTSPILASTSGTTILTSSSSSSASSTSSNSIVGNHSTNNDTNSHI